MNWSSQTKEIVHTESLAASPEAVEAAEQAEKAMASTEPLGEAALLFLKALFPPPAEDVPALLDCFFALMDLKCCREGFVGMCRMEPLGLLCFELEADKPKHAEADPRQRLPWPLTMRNFSHGIFRGLARGCRGCRAGWEGHGLC